VKKRPGKGRAAPLENHAEYIEGRERIGDREVEFRRYLDAEGHVTWTQYGPLREQEDGELSRPTSYLCHNERTGRWWIESDYRHTVIERQLSRRTTRRKQGMKWHSYLLELAVEFWHVKLVNNPKHRVAGDSARWRGIIRRAVIRAVRDLDPSPIDRLSDAISAVRWVKERPIENELVMRAILAAARAHQGVPYRSEVKELISLDVPISVEKAAWNERLESIGFYWLPGGRPRKPKIRIPKIHSKGSGQLTN
jgi:hypothetical protein